MKSGKMGVDGDHVSGRRVPITEASVQVNMKIYGVTPTNFGLERLLSKYVVAGRFSGRRLQGNSADQSSGRGRLVNMGKRNPHGRFVVVNYRWSRRDKKRYDDDGQPPRSYTVHPDIPVLPVSFLSLVWTYEKYPIGTRAAEFAANHRFQTRWPSIIVCDVFPIRCIRQRHARFILPWEIVHKEASAVEHHGKFHLDEGILDNYHTSEDELIQVILSALTGTLTTSLGTRVEGCEYAVYLKDIMAGGVLGYSSIKDEDTQFEEGYS